MKIYVLQIQKKLNHYNIPLQLQLFKMVFVGETLRHERCCEISLPSQSLGQRSLLTNKTRQHRGIPQYNTQLNTIDRHNYTTDYPDLLWYLFYKLYAFFTI